MLGRPLGGALERRAACGLAGGLLDLRHVAARIDDPGRAVWRWLLVLDGAGRAVDGAGRAWELAPGVLFIRPQRTPHRLERRGPWLEFYLSLPAALAEGFAAVGLIDATASCWRPADLPGLHRAIAAWLPQVARARTAVATAALLGATAGLLAAAAPARGAARRRLPRPAPGPGGRTGSAGRGSAAPPRRPRPSARRLPRAPRLHAQALAHPPAPGGGRRPAGVRRHRDAGRRAPGLERRQRLRPPVPRPLRLPARPLAAGALINRRRPAR